MTTRDGVGWSITAEVGLRMPGATESRLRQRTPIGMEGWSIALMSSGDNSWSTGSLSTFRMAVDGEKQTDLWNEETIDSL